MLETVRYVSGGKFIARGEWIHPDRVIHSRELILMIEGTAYLNENGVDYALQKNDLLVLDPHVRHYGYRVSEDASFYWLHWNEEGYCPNVIHASVKSPYTLSLLFHQLLHYAAAQYDCEVLDCATRLIVAELDRLPENAVENALVNRVADWISANADTPVKVSDVSARFGYHTDYISRLFKECRGQSLKEYIDQVKCQSIKSYLLNTNLTLQEIASVCGFAEYKYFLKFFKYHEGMTPTEFCNVYSRMHINHR